MSDIINELRERSLRAEQEGEPLALLDEAADEIARLRSQPCPYVVGRTTLHCSLTPFTLTDKERAALKDCVHAYGLDDDDEECASIANTLRGLLERTKTLQKSERDVWTDNPPG